MKTLDELDALHAAATAGEWVVRSYQEPSGEHNPAPSWEAYGEDNLVLTAALHNAWPSVSARLRAAEAEVERLRTSLALAHAVLRAIVDCDDAINAGGVPPLSRAEVAALSRALAFRAAARQP